MRVRVRARVLVRATLDLHASATVFRVQQAQDVMTRAMLDTFLAAADFGTEVDALNFQPCKIIELQHYATYEALADYANPLRKYIRRFLPFLPYSRRYKRNHEQMYGIWDSWADTLTQQPKSDAASDRLSLGDTLLQLVKEPADGACTCLCACMHVNSGLHRSSPCKSCVQNAMVLPA